MLEQLSAPDQILHGFPNLLLVQKPQFPEIRCCLLHGLEGPETGLVGRAVRSAQDPDGTPWTRRELVLGIVPKQPQQLTVRIPELREVNLRAFPGGWG